MTASSLDLGRFIGEDLVNETWASAWTAQVFDSLKGYSPARSLDHWPTAIEHLRGDLDQLLGRGEIGNGSAAHAWFVLDLLQSALVDPSEGGGWFVLGYIVAISLTSEKWQQWLKASSQGPKWRRRPKASSQGPQEQKPTLAEFPADVLPALFRRQRRDILSGLYSLVRGRIQPLRQDCIRHSPSHDQWVHSMARLYTALKELNFVPITTSSKSGKKTWHPLAQYVFTSDQLTEQRRDQAFFEEQFAHLYSAIISGCDLPGYIDKLRGNLVTLSAHSPRDARQELRLMRSRFRVPPYLFKDLDNSLRM